MQSPLAGVTEGRVPDVMGKTGRLDEVGINPVILSEQIGSAIQTVADTAPNLSDFDRMGQTGAVEIIFAAEKDLRFILQPPKRGCMNNTIPIDLK